MRVPGQWATRLWKRSKKESRGTCEGTGGVLGYGREAKKKEREDSRGTCEGIGWATMGPIRFVPHWIRLATSTSCRFKSKLP